MVNGKGTEHKLKKVAKARKQKLKKVRTATKKNSNGKTKIKKLHFTLFFLYFFKFKDA